MKPSSPSKGETLRELKLRHIAALKEEFGSSRFIDQLQREVDDASQPNEKRVIGVVSNTPAEPEEREWEDENLAIEAEKRRRLRVRRMRDAALSQKSSKPQKP
jgi:hypothetical protein